MEFANDCKVMKKHFPCERGCWNEVGNDIPAYVVEGDQYGGMCLVSMDSFPVCTLQNKASRRLCVCVHKDSVVDYDIKTPVLGSPKLGKNVKMKMVQFKKGKS